MKWSCTCSLRRRLVVLVAALVTMGLGIALFKLAAFGNDPFSGMCMAFADRLGIRLGTVEIVVNLFCFVFMIWLLRGRIGVGTVANMLSVGYLVEGWHALWLHFLPSPQGLAARVAIMLVALLILSLACSLYFTTDLGIAPYDSLAFILEQRLHWPYALCRILTDSTCVVFCWLAGGVLGVGILVAAFCMGPFISFFDAKVSRRLLQVRTENAEPMH